MKTVKDIRTTFLDFFKGKGHEVVASSPLVPQNDPTLMFANSGMVQFKNCFLGAEKRPYTRATTAQKCVRAGGKHNDLDNVGYTARHHTFFEMMGNFSFGDYFKDDAIAFAWELVTKHLDLPREKLLVTVHSSDEEAAAIWRKVAGFSDDRIIRIGTNDNFWMMGDTGPCGPCSEIFIDQGDKLAGGPPGSPDQDGDRFLEFWNLVFMQFEQEPDGKGGYIRKPLPRPAIDTGMGLERTAAILQGKYSNYDVDLLRAIIEHSATLTGVSPDGAQAASHRVVADHLRASAFLMADGVMPSNEGRGYVLRRIMRRGMRHAHLLGAKDPLMHALFPTLLSLMGETYPELHRAQALIVETLRIEETRFRRTLETGLRILDEEAGRLGANGILAGDIAFKLYDTYGFPVDLTADALRSKNLGVDRDGFEAAMKRQRETARKSWSGSGEAATDRLWFDVLETVGPTEFLGYDAETAEGQILAILKDGQRVSEAREGEDVAVLANQSPFYAESGGQVGDTGVFLTAQGDSFAVSDTAKMLGKLWVHRGCVTKGRLSVGEGVEMRVDGVRRAAIRANHSATHLLHAALHEHVGAHVTQKGSSVDENRLRFDVSLNAPLTPEQIEKIERTVNAQILANTEIRTRLMPVEDAMQAGAMALFGEKYDEEVRVLSMGTTPLGAARPFSVELCGGTHARRTGDIGLFKLTSDSALSAGVRRIEGLTGTGAMAYLTGQDETVHALSVLLNTAPAEIVERVRALAEERRKLDKQIADLRRQMATGGGASAGPAIKDVGGVKFIGRVVDLPPRDLKPLADDFKDKMGSGVVALVSTYEGKASLVVGVTADLTARYSAVDLVKIGAAALGGQGGGGRPDMAQAGGPKVDAANDAVAAIEAAMG
jgi:alanyl-tRNA synthetase